jgi:aerotaxis receptor
MRVNQPVTQREHAIGDGETLMSATDLKGRITFVNDSFIEISGFPQDELLRQPHNIVRHPDMPPEAFADLWATLKSGRCWSALLKNRRKDGDHYWVRANATPIRHGGSVAGYVSIRTKPSRAEVAAAETLYAAMRAGKAPHLAFHRGWLVRRGVLGLLSRARNLPLRWQVRAAMAIPLLASLAALAGAGVPAGAAAAVAGAVLAGVAGAAAILNARMAAPIAGILDKAQCVASGQPGEDTTLDRADELGMLMRAVNQSGLNLRLLVGDVGRRICTVTGTCGELAGGNADLSSRTEQAAASLQQTAASMEQMASAVKQNVDSTEKAKQAAASASEVALQGGAVVGQVVQNMQDISASSRRIADIIAVIDGIAFQTNILALNAAVEAARAGEQGRGFAVVAGEVRSLAQRSAQAAKEIKELISDSVGSVEQGARQVEEAGRTMDRIVAQVKHVTDMIGEIAVSTLQQCNGIDQVNQAVTQLDQVTQRNAAFVEQSSAAAMALKKQAEGLAATVNLFDARA